jgi:hypothetical protein
MLGIHKGVTQRPSPDGSLSHPLCWKNNRKNIAIQGMEKSLTRNLPANVELDGEADLRANSA